MIDSFTGVNDFLSNFYPSSIWYNGDPYATVEQAFQASKTFSDLERQEILAALTPGQAKRLGKKCTLRADWELVKLDIMSELLRKKFSNVTLAKLLIATGDEELIEGNSWGDTYWGVCNGVGENNLGKLLMKVRDELRQSQGS